MERFPKGSIKVHSRGVSSRRGGVQIPPSSTETKGLKQVKEIISMNVVKSLGKDEFEEWQGFLLAVGFLYNVSNKTGSCIE